MGVDPDGLAYLQKRPLDIGGLRSTTAGPFNHTRFLYDNGTDSGFYSDANVKADDPRNPIVNKYVSVGDHLQDDILHQAESNLNAKWNTGNSNDYWTAFINCHDYTNAVLHEYNRIIANNQPGK